mgnify:CR=1 FL=1
MANQVIEKHPAAVIRFADFDFTDDLPDDTTLSASSTVTAVDAAGTSAPTVVSTVSISGMILRAVLTLGTNGQDYTVTFNAIGGTTGHIIVKQLEMRVRTKLTGAL